MAIDANAITTAFKGSSKESQSFSEALMPLLPVINLSAPNADNWQLLFDLLYFTWTGEGGDQVSVADLDALSLKLSPFRQQGAAVITNQQQDAVEFVAALNHLGINPSEALGLCQKETQMMSSREDFLQGVVNSPSPMPLVMALVKAIRAFYRANKRHNPSRSSVLKPLLLAKEAVLKSRSTGADLQYEVAGAIASMMSQVRNNTASGFWVINQANLERQAINEFAYFFVFHVFEGKLQGSRAEVSSQRFKLLEDSYWALYLLEQDKENQSS